MQKISCFVKISFVLGNKGISLPFMLFFQSTDKIKENSEFTLVFIYEIKGIKHKASARLLLY